MRSRNIKPSFFKNELLSELDAYGRLLFIGLWCLADKQGLLELRPKRIKAEIFPYEEHDVNGYLTVMERLGFIQTLTDGTNQYLLILNFKKHQHPHNTETTLLPDVKSLKLFEKLDNGEITVKQPLDNGDKRADSCILIPDSCILIPDSSSSSNDSDSTPKVLVEEFKDAEIRCVPDPDVGPPPKIAAKPPPSKERKNFTKPTLEEVTAYCLERKNNIDPKYWFDYYESNGWMVGRNKMKDWRASVRTWEKNNYNKRQEPKKLFQDFQERIAISPILEKLRQQKEGSHE